MALDWNKDISFSGLKKSPQKAKGDYPSKTYMNLAPTDKKSIDARRAIPTAVIVVVLVALFVKFGVYDFYDRVNQKQAELNKQEQTLGSLQVQLADYDEILETYNAYASAYAASDEYTVSALDALALVDRFVRPSANVASLDLQGNVLSLNLSNITLDEVGKLVSTLYEQKIVADVSVSTAATQQTSAEDVTASMVITLQVA